MTAKEKVMITEITSAIELTINPAWERPKKMITAIEKSAGKLAHKLIRNAKKAEKAMAKAAHKRRPAKVSASA